MIFALHVVQPAAHAQERLVRRHVMLSLLRVYESDRVEQIHAVGLLLQFPDQQVSGMQQNI